MSDNTRPNAFHVSSTILRTFQVAECSQQCQARDVISSVLAAVTQVNLTNLNRAEVPVPIL